MLHSGHIRRGRRCARVLPLAAVSFCLLTILCGIAPAQNAPARPEDERAIRAIIAGLSEAWTAGDAEGWAEPFTEDADFTVWNGLYVKGRAEIARGHEQIFNTIYRDTKHRFVVRSVRFLGGGVAVVHAGADVVRKGADFPASPQVAPAFVFVKEGGRWRIAVFHNTRVQAFQR